MSQPRCCHTATQLADGRVLVVAGRTPAECMGDEDPRPCTATTDSVELWDPRTGRFSQGPALGERNDRAGHTATLLRDGRVLIAGGAPFVYGTPNDFSLHDLLFDPARTSWQPIDGVHRVYHTATLLPDGSVLAVGGAHDMCGCCARASRATGPFVVSILHFDPATLAWTAAGTSLVARDRHGAALLSDGSVLVIGGESQEWGRRGDPFAQSERWFPAGK
jgi:hypothetical protein